MGQKKKKKKMEGPSSYWQNFLKFFIQFLKISSLLFFILVSFLWDEIHHHFVWQFKSTVFPAEIYEIQKRSRKQSTIIYYHLYYGHNSKTQTRIKHLGCRNVFLISAIKIGWKKPNVAYVFQVSLCSVNL